MKLFAPRTSRALFSTLSHFIMSNETVFLQRLIHTESFLNVPEPNKFCSQDIVSLLQYLSDTKRERYAKSLHSLSIKAGFDMDVYVQNNLIKFYASSSELENAHQVFDEMPERDLVSWTSIVSSYVHAGQFNAGMRMFCLMCRSGLRPNQFGFSVALKACKLRGNFALGMLIHGQIMKCGFELDRFCSAAILGIYVEHGDVSCAQQIFNGIPWWGKSEALWNTLLDGYVRICDEERALQLYRQMRCSDVSPNCFTYSILSRICANTFNFDLGRLFHGQIIKVGLESDIVVGGSLVDTYARMGFMDDALEVFQNLEEKDNVVWCSLLSAICQFGHVDQGLSHYLKFLSEGNKPDPFTYASVFSMCSELEPKYFGTQVHCSLIKDGFTMDSFIGSALVDMYGAVGMVCDALQCFLEIRNKNEICFNSMINNLVLNSFDQSAISLFNEMRNLDLVPGHSTVSYVLRSCANLKFLREGKSLHSLIIKYLGEFEPDLHIENALVELYAKCGGVDDAYLIFTSMKMRNESSWTTIISGLRDSGKFEEALGLFRELLLSSASEKPGPYTVVAVIQACTELKALTKGKQIHCYVVKVGFVFHSFVGSALINMYAMTACEVQNAFRLFLALEERDLVSWSTMMTAWAQNGYYEEALKLFVDFQNAPNFSLDEVILSSSLSACAGLAALEAGKCLHAYSIRAGFKSRLHVASSIIDMYSKCGIISEAHRLFYELEDQNLVSWTTMMSGYAFNGLGNEAIDLFFKMKKAKLEPDGITFLAILTACSHAGLVKEGWQVFESMINDCGLEGTINHYACMVDLFGRAELVDEAEALINKAPFSLKSKSLLWKVLLGACNKLGNIEISNRIAQMMVGLEANESSTYIMLSNVYASASMWDNSTKMRNKMKAQNVAKEPGYSWIQLET